MKAIHFNPFNSIEEKVLESKRISFFKGQMTVKFKDDSWLTNGRSGSFGIIFINKADKTFSAEDLNHERGHFTQFLLLGPVKYTVSIAMPSVLSGDLSTLQYYSMPWDRSADYFGGLSRGYMTGSETVSALYFLCWLLI